MLSFVLKNQWSFIQEATIWSIVVYTRIIVVRNTTIHHRLYDVYHHCIHWLYELNHCCVPFNLVLFSLHLQNRSLKFMKLYMKHQFEVLLCISLSSSAPLIYDRVTILRWFLVLFGVTRWPYRYIVGTGRTAGNRRYGWRDFHHLQRWSIWLHVWYTHHQSTAVGYTRHACHI